MKENKNEMEKRNNLVWEFFKPNLWKVILTLILGLIFFLFSFPRQYIIVKDFIGNNPAVIDTPIGITNISIIILISIVGGYILSSIIIFMLNRVNRGGRK